MRIIFRFLSIIVALILSNLALTKESGLDFGYQGLKGIPIPYGYNWFPTFPSSQNNLLYTVDFTFWIIVFNLAISFIVLRKSKKNLGNGWIFSKESFYVLIISVAVFIMSLAFQFALGPVF